MPALPARTRYGPATAAGILITSVLLPPVAAYARQYAYAQALQFLIFAVAGPALLVLGTPWRSRPPAWRPGSGGRRGGPGGRAAVRLVAFIALVVSWRLPVIVNALARNPALVAAEMVTLLAAGTGVWLELVSTPTAPSQLPRPARAAMAAAAMWTIWILAYLTGMSGATWFAAYHQGAPGSLSAAADQQIAVAILWAVPALCFLPVIYHMVIAWLGGTASPAGNESPAVSSSTPTGWPRPPRGWRSPHTPPLRPSRRTRHRDEAGTRYLRATSPPTQAGMPPARVLRGLRDRAARRARRRRWRC